MRAIIITENSQCDMSPLTDRIPHALLPLAGKSILLHALQTLHRASIMDVFVVAPKLCEDLHAAVDTSSLPGMQLRFVSECPDLCHSSELSLVIGLSDLFDVDWDEVLYSLGVVKVHFLIPSILRLGTKDVALLAPPYFDGKLSADWSEVGDIEAVQVQLSGHDDCRVPTNSFLDYHIANLQVLHCKYENLSPSGRKRASGYHIGQKSKIHEKSMQSERGYVGSHCRIEKSVSLSGDVIIGDQVMIASGTNVSDSIICDNTYIGANLDCRNSIVSGNLLIRVDTGSCLELEDPTLLGAVA
jgi:NDP-sugar pyrophosphorylase family protein